MSVNPEDYHCTSTSRRSRPFSDTELAVVPDAVKAIMIEQATRRFPMARRLVANAMIGAIALLLTAQRENQPP